MDSKRFDNFTRRLSRRQAIGAAGVTGLAAAMTRALPASAQTSGVVTCQMVMQALTSAGPSSGQAYGGALQITLNAEGAVQQGSFTPDGGIAAPVVGQTNGRAVSLRITFADGQALVLNGTGENDLTICSGALSGVFGGPQLGDTGSWQIDPTQSQPGVVATTVPVVTEPAEQCPGVVCAAIFTLDMNTCECVCPESTLPCGSTCCPGDGMCVDANTGQCSCADGTQWCGGSCVPDCGVTLTLDPNTCECACPPPYEICGFVCCPGGSVCTDPNNGECSCPSGTELCGDNCVSSCGDGFSLDPTTCECV